MPIGPIGQQTINPIENVTSSDSPAHPVSLTTPEAVAQPETTATLAKLATEVVQNARAAKATEPTTRAALGNLVDSVASQMGSGKLPDESRQRLASLLADDPVVKGLLG